jgi:phosphoribosylformimino-5-aminoimidazole carboxamide ribotide isomerase
MLIIPAIDLIGGRCVRLVQGRFDQPTTYGDPFEQLAAFEAAGAEWVHIVDLDGARDGERRQTGLVGKLADATRVKIQCGGGVRRSDDLVALFDAGVARAVIGSAAVLKPAEVISWIQEFSADKICCAFDVRIDKTGDALVATHGWKDDGAISLDEALAQYPPGALKHSLVTDISRDGALSGPNAGMIEDLVGKRGDLSIQASGGVSSLADLSDLKKTGAAAAIVGKALYERRFTLEEALGC